MRGLNSHHCGLGLISGPGVTCVLCFSLVLILAPRVFLPDLYFSSLPKNQHSKFQFDLETLDKKSQLVEFPLLNPVSFYFIRYILTQNQQKHHDAVQTYLTPAIGLLPEVVDRVKVWIQRWYHFVTTLPSDVTYKAQDIKIQIMSGCGSSYAHNINIFVFSLDSFFIGYPHTTPPLQMKRVM